VSAPVLRAVNAGFGRDGRTLVAPFSLTLAASDTGDLLQPGARAASIAARMCAAIIKPSEGTIYIGDFETRLQPPQAKRLVGYVDAAGFVGDDHALHCEVAFRAEVWGIEPSAAQARVKEVLAAFAKPGGALDPYVRAVALALVPPVSLVVLDQPAGWLMRRVQQLVPSVGILVTRVSASAQLESAQPAHAGVT
jgi:ABC-type taurine transport system ATPase subunit